MEKSIQALVGKIKKEMFPNNSTDVHHLVLASAYDTAWLAMIPDLEDPNRPMFPQSLEWILSNQQEEFGFWGESNPSNLATIESIPATVACVAALKTWGVGHDSIVKGLAFIHANAEKLLSEQSRGRTRWFAIVFPGMLERAWSKGVNIFPTGIPEPISLPGEAKASLISFPVFELKEESILNLSALENCDQALFCLQCRKTSPNQVHDPPLIYYLEALPPAYEVDCNMVLPYLNEDGSLFRSPSATAAAFMVTKDKKCKNYLESIVKMCGSGVPPVFPVEEDLIELCIVERLERLGLDDHFHREIKDVLEGVYRNQIERVPEPIKGQSSMLQIYKESLAYRLLTMHGYRTSPKIIEAFAGMFSSFFEGGDNNAWNVDQSHEFFLSTILNVYRAADFIFSEKDEAGNVMSLARNLLEEGLRKAKLSTASNLRIEVEHELSVPWLARLDHLEHRDFIERGETNDLWPGKASYLRQDHALHDANGQNQDTLLEQPQFVGASKTQLRPPPIDIQERIGRVKKDHGICSLGFGREKTTYCYFAVATTMYHTHMTEVRMTAAKNGLLLTIIDDFFDCYATLDELTIFTDAIERLFYFQSSHPPYFAVATTMYHTHMTEARMTAAKNGLLLTIIDDFFDCYATLDELTIFTDAIER
ncbi:hypothetical protein ACLOJK_010220 [Asimina triloba]